MYVSENKVYLSCSFVKISSHSYKQEVCNMIMSEENARAISYQMSNPNFKPESKLHDSWHTIFAWLVGVISRGPMFKGLQGLLMDLKRLGPLTMIGYFYIVTPLLQ